METVTIKTLSLINFKGIRDLTIPFGHNNVTISGYNATGKTTIMDAFIWLLFGKDSTGRKDFELKTLDDNNQFIPKLNHEVSAIIQINEGKEIALKRCLKEKWTKRRGSEDPEFTGHETLFYIDEVPYQSGHYADKINSIIDELVFKMITDPHFFNSMKWQDRRTILINLAGDVKDEDIAKTKSTFEKLLSELSGKSFEEFRRSIAEKKKRLKDDITLIPPRIDEISRTIPDKEPDYQELENNLKVSSEELSKTEGMIASALKLSEEILKKEQARQQQVYSLKEQLRKIEYSKKEESNSGARQKESELLKLNDELKIIGQRIDSIDSAFQNTEAEIKFKEGRMNELREQWTEVNSRQLSFGDEDFTCPTCKRPYEPKDVETQKNEMLTNFNRSKLAECEGINKHGKELADLVKKLKEQNNERHDLIIELTDREKELDAKIKAIKDEPIKANSINLDEIPEYKNIKKQIEALEAEIFLTPDDQELRQKKTEILGTIELIKKDLAIREAVKKVNARIAELENEIKEKSQLLFDMEKQEFIMSEFEQAKMTMVEQRVNGMFKLVRFKMFEQLINGGIEPTCITLIDGIPWQDANNAGRINGGLDIINILNQYYHASGPIFIDNAEAVNELFPVSSQVIRLVVSNDRELKIETNEN
jgi:DNA repair exonuclease SbcCD ATPase subunit